MERVRKVSLRLLVCSVFLILLSACKETSYSIPNPSDSSSSSVTLPSKAPVNLVVAINDEAPIIVTSNGQPKRQDSQSQNQTIFFNGFNEN